jgi:hypothetical protein
MVSMRRFQQFVPGSGPTLKQRTLWLVHVLIGRPKQNPPDRPKETLGQASLDHQAVLLQQCLKFTCSEDPQVIRGLPIRRRSNLSLNGLGPFIRNTDEVQGVRLTNSYKFSNKSVWRLDMLKDFHRNHPASHSINQWQRIRIAGDCLPGRPQPSTFFFDFLDYLRTDISGDHFSPLAGGKHGCASIAAPHVNTDVMLPERKARSQLSGSAVVPALALGILVTTFKTAWQSPGRLTEKMSN